ncbi:MAG TPA: hypothetical protein DCM05_16150 [Elusimicrobia bacterium]|nr:hypothetical protein [Elusimicrobiota bacterium]
MAAPRDKEESKAQEPERSLRAPGRRRRAPRRAQPARRGWSAFRGPLPLKTQQRLLLASLLLLALAAVAVFIRREQADETLTASYRTAVRSAQELLAVQDEPRRQAAVQSLNEDLQALEERREAVHRMSYAAFLALFLLGMAFIVLTHVYLARTLYRPIIEMSRLAMTWVPERSWPDAPRHSPAEVHNLYLALRFLMDRLSSELKNVNAVARLKGDIVSIISHESSNALSIIGGVLALLRETDQSLNEKRRGFYDTAQISIRSLALQTQSLLNMGRLESGKLALRFKSVSVPGTVQECLERLKILYERKGQRIVLEVPEQGLWVRADPDALALVLTNLLSNAIKYTPDQGCITLTGLVDPDDPTRARISVKDTGIGISAEDQQRVLSGYFRTEAGKAAAKGVGVGLSLARKILEAHYSVLLVESSPGQGTTFRFSMRLCRGADQ